MLPAGAVHGERVQVAVDELDRLEEPAGRRPLPDLAEAAVADRLDEAVAGDGLRVGLAIKTHGSVLWSGPHTLVTRPGGHTAGVQRARGRSVARACRKGSTEA